MRNLQKNKLPWAKARDISQAEKFVFRSHPRNKLRGIPAQNKKNIWILNHYAITPDMPGGTRHYDFGSELVKRGYGVTIFASSFHYLWHKELKLKKREKYKIENVDGINFVWIKTFSYKKNNWRRVLNMISYMCRVYWLGKKITRKNKDISNPDIIIGSSVHLLTVLSAYFLSKYYKAKFIMEVRDLWPQTLIDVGNLKENSLIVKILRFLEKYLYNRAKRIIVLMSQAEDYIIPLGINKDKIVWICNGVNITKFKKVRKEKSDKYFKVIYLGAHGVANALDIVLDTAEKIQKRGYKDIKILLYGDGSEKRRLIKYKEKLKLKNLEFHNPFSKEKIFNLLLEADILLINYRKSNIFKYGISHNKLFDCMASGKPIIYAGEYASNPVNISKCGISILPEDSKELMNAIIGLYKISSEERNRMGRRGREYVEKYYSIPVLVDKLEKVIRQI